MKSFSDRLVLLRKERGMTQLECAKALSVGRSTYSGYENEGKEPNYTMLFKLADLFGVSTDYLLGRSDIRTKSEVKFAGNAADFERLYKNLPASSKEPVQAACDAFYSLLGRDMVKQEKRHLDIYAELFELMDERRNAISNAIGLDKSHNSLFVSTLMTEQNGFKNDISSLLDKLMQADLSVAPHTKSMD